MFFPIGEGRFSLESVCFFGLGCGISAIMLKGPNVVKLINIQMGLAIGNMVLVRMPKAVRFSYGSRATY
jgi:hypothetical protein